MVRPLLLASMAIPKEPQSLLGFPKPNVKLYFLCGRYLAGPTSADTNQIRNRSRQPQRPIANHHGRRGKIPRAQIKDSVHVWRDPYEGFNEETIVLLVELSAAWNAATSGGSWHNRKCRHGKRVHALHRHLGGDVIRIPRSQHCSVSAFCRNARSSSLGRQVPHQHRVGR